MKVIAGRDDDILVTGLAGLFLIHERAAVDVGFRRDVGDLNGSTDVDGDAVGPASADADRLEIVSIDGGDGNTFDRVHPRRDQTLLQPRPIAKHLSGFGRGARESRVASQFDVRTADAAAVPKKATPPARTFAVD